MEATPLPCATPLPFCQPPHALSQSARALSQSARALAQSARALAQSARALARPERRAAADERLMPALTGAAFRSAHTQKRTTARMRQRAGDRVLGRPGRAHGGRTKKRHPQPSHEDHGRHENMKETIFKLARDQASRCGNYSTTSFTVRCAEAVAARTT